MLYAVFTQPNVTFTANGTDPDTNLPKTYSSAVDLTGWNDAFVMGGKTVFYIVIPWPGGTNVSANGLGDWDSVTEAISHEIAESVTGQQIADKTERFHVRMSNGVAVQEVGQPGDLAQPIPIPGATRLPS